MNLVASQSDKGGCLGVADVLFFFIELHYTTCTIMISYNNTTNCLTFLQTDAQDQNQWGQRGMDKVQSRCVHKLCSSPALDELKAYKQLTVCMYVCMYVHLFFNFHFYIDFVSITTLILGLPEKERMTLKYSQRSFLLGSLPVQ